MPVFELSRRLVFPPPHLAEPDGLLAVGGDLSVERLLLAYRSGIFPWYEKGAPLLWWSPDPRCVLFPERLHISHSLRQTLNASRFRATVDGGFRSVIRHCATARRRGQRGTWITAEMLEAYVRLHEAGYAHSVEVWEGNRLAGGLYGVALGRCFFGESMFSRVANASKCALVFLVRGLQGLGFAMIDCQVESPHLLRLGAQPIPRPDFLARLRQALASPTLKGDWSALAPFQKSDFA